MILNKLTKEEIIDSIQEDLKERIKMKGWNHIPKNKQAKKQANIPK